MSKRYYFETEETKIVKKKGWVEIDTDFTQVYTCFKEISKDINSPTTWKLLFWLLSEKINKQNGFITDKGMFDHFNAYLSADCADCGISRTTFQNSIKELVDCKAITQINKSHYYFSPYIFWKDSKDERKQFIEAENKENRYLSHNPKQEIKEETGIYISE